MRKLGKDLKVGDVLVMLGDGHGFYKKGDKCTVDGITRGCVYGDFKGQDNKYVHDDGIWVIGVLHDIFEVITEEEHVKAEPVESKPFKTFHRLMYENLSAEDYKMLCRVDKRAYEAEGFQDNLKRDYSEKKPDDALVEAFDWCDSGVYDDPYNSFDYWSEVRQKLEKKSV